MPQSGFESENQNLKPSRLVKRLEFLSRLKELPNTVGGPSSLWAAVVTLHQQNWIWHDR
jgi:hypothetical protein